jgi:DNA polymerase III gamma/tau subunit
LGCIFAKEEIKITPEALLAIASCSQGGMRDSIQLLYQLASTSEHIDSDRVYRAIGGISIELLHSLVEALINKQIHSILDLTTQTIEADVEVQQVFTSILAVWKDLLAIALTTKKSTSTEYETSLSSPLSFKTLQSAANKLSVDTIIAQFQQLETAERRINYSSNSHLWLQTTLLSLVV